MNITHAQKHLFITLLLFLTTSLSQAQFEDAKWIWVPSAMSTPLGSLPASVGYFRGEVNIPETPALEYAEVIATCDNLFVLHINGRAVGESEASNNAWQTPHRWNLTGMMAPGRSVLAVEAVNTLPGPAALIVSFKARLADGQEIILNSGVAWKSNANYMSNWEQPDFDDQKWATARVMGDYGISPWGKVTIPQTARQGGEKIGAVQEMTAQVLEQAAQQGRVGPVEEMAPAAKFIWPKAVLFLGDDCTLYRPHGATGLASDSLSVTLFNPRKSRGFPEHDLPGPMKMGRKLYRLSPARPGVEPQVLLDAGKGGIGSPSVSFDGKSILISMAQEGEGFFHIYRIDSENGKLEQLTDGPFHDIDPTEMPDGRIVFTSTRMGTFEEYHSPPSRALFTMRPNGADIHMLTSTIIFDNEPEVLADGRILILRSDNFFDRGKVETLLHAVFPDGTRGQTEFGLDNGPEYGSRLRAFVCGSPAPMPDGRVAFVSGPGITVGRLGAPASDLQHFSLPAGDVAALPDGRLLCTVPSQGEIEEQVGDKVRKVSDLIYDKIAILNPEGQQPTLTVLYDSSLKGLHSPVYLGKRNRPLQLVEALPTDESDTGEATGFLYCQNARFTQNNTAGWEHVRAIRVLAGKGLTTRSSHSYIVHQGNETVELGTVPLAPDGSFYLEVPADTPLALQAVDAEGRSEINEMSWIYVRKGEQRGCIGCHAKRQSAPPSGMGSPLATRAKPLRLLGKGEPHRFRGNNAAVTGLMEIQFDRYREVAGLNRHDSQGTGKEEIADFIEMLRDEDADLRMSAAQQISIFRDPAAAPALAERLGDSSREVRVAVAVALAACGNRASLPALRKALGDSDPLVAQAAAMAFGNITGSDELFNGFAQPGKRGAWENETDLSEQELIASLQSADKSVVRRAAVALGHLGTVQAVSSLRSYIAKERGNNPYPEWRKSHRGDNARFNSLSPANPRTLQEVVRGLGRLKDAESVPLLVETLQTNIDPVNGNLFLAEAAVEALGSIATPEAEQALIETFAKLQDYPKYTYWYGDHEALMACHASPVHYLIAEALDTRGSAKIAPIVPHLIRSVPIDPDRGLFLENDDYETVIARLIGRSGIAPQVIETCLAILGDSEAKASKEIDAALAHIIRCWAGHPDKENRAAQILSLVCRDTVYEPRIRTAYERYRGKKNTIPRVFDNGIPQVQELPLKHWVCFYLGRTLGNLGDSHSVDTLIASLANEPTEAATGHPDPLGPGVLFLHNDVTPCWRAAAAWALGQIGEARSVPALLEVIGDLKNAPDTRHAAAVALGKIGEPSSIAKMEALAEDYPEVATRRALYGAVRKATSISGGSGATRP